MLFKSKGQKSSVSEALNTRHIDGGIKSGPAAFRGAECRKAASRLAHDGMLPISDTSGLSAVSWEERHLRASSSAWTTTPPSNTRKWSLHVSATSCAVEHRVPSCLKSRGSGSFAALRYLRGRSTRCTARCNSAVGACATSSDKVPEWATLSALQVIRRRLPNLRKSMQLWPRRIRSNQSHRPEKSVPKSGAWDLQARKAHRR